MRENIRGYFLMWQLPTAPQRRLTVNSIEDVFRSVMDFGRVMTAPAVIQENNDPAWRTIE